MSLTLKRRFGMGDGAPQNSLPASLALDAEGQLYVACGSEVRVFAEDGELVQRIAIGQPIACLVIAEEQLWIAVAGAIRMVGLDGRPRGVWAGGDALGRVTGLAVGADVLVVADAAERELCRYDRSGKFLGALGDDVNRRGFLIPNGTLSVAADPDGESLWVAHPGKHRLERYRYTGEYCGSFGRFGNQGREDFAGCCNPTTVVAAPSGLLWVAEKAPPRVKAYTAAGQLVAWTDDGAFDPLAKNLALAADAEGRLAATDPPRREVCDFDVSEFAARAATRAPDDAPSARSLP